MVVRMMANVNKIMRTDKTSVYTEKALSPCITRLTKFILDVPWYRLLRLIRIVLCGSPERRTPAARWLQISGKKTT